MSMIAYVIFQEPFYRAIKRCRDIIPISLPNNFSISVAGYADDSSVFVRELNSLIILSEIVMNFEFATGAKLNREKTKIMGLGNWKDRDRWPIDELKIEKECKILGIYYSNDYKETVHRNWEICTNKINSRINMLSDRFLSLYQKAMIINSLVLSKIWYISHVFPLGRNHVKEIEKKGVSLCMERILSTSETRILIFRKV